MSVRNKASKVVTLNGHTAVLCGRAIDASHAGKPHEAIRANIQLLEAHMSYQPATPDGEARYRRAQRTIANLRKQLEELRGYIE